MLQNYRRVGVVALLFAGKTIAAGFLNQGCDSLFFVQNGILIAKCDDQVCGKKVYSHLDLNNCIINENGNMYYGKKGNFYHTCKQCWIAASHHLSCVCGSNNGDEYTALLDLNVGVITNYYGYVDCYATIGNNPAHNWPCKGSGWKPWDHHTAPDNATTLPKEDTPEPSMGPLNVTRYG